MIRAIDLITKHEGCRLKAYRDTLGHPTIGYGRCLDCKGISQSEANLLLSHDIDDLYRGLGEYSWYRNATVQRQAVLVDMAFNLGIKGLLEFRDMVAAMERSDWNAAANEMLDSKWAKQVGERAREDAELLRNG